MYTVEVNLNIPLKVQNVEGISKYDAAENVRKLITQTLPLVISENLEKIQDRLCFEVLEIEEE